MISELQYTGGRKDWLLTVVADYGNSYFELLQSLIGIVASKQYYHGETLATMGQAGSFREKVYDAFLDIKRNIKLPRTVSDYVESSFDLALGSMFPMLVMDNHTLYFMHPILLGFIKKWNLLGKDDSTTKETLIHLLKLLEKTKDGTYMKLFLSEEAEYFQKRGIPKLAFIQGLTRVGHLIKMTKLIESTWIQFTDVSEM
jgi:hypothetical protein